MKFEVQESILDMKKCNIAIIFIFFCTFANFLFFGCKKKEQNVNVPVEYIKINQTFHINKTENSPSCKIEIKFGYLKNDKDSIATIINQSLIDRILGKDFYNLSPQAAVDSFRNSYIDNYTNEVGLLFEEDTKDGKMNTPVPSWYNYIYKLSTDMFSGKNNIIYAKATIYEYTGGAHPNELEKWLNFDINTGKIITLDDIFLKGYEQPLSNILQKKLTDYISSKYKGAHFE